jgi:hypothetical protein
MPSNKLPITKFHLLILNVTLVNNLPEETTDGVYCEEQRHGQHTEMGFNASLAISIVSSVPQPAAAIKRATFKRYNGFGQLTLLLMQKHMEVVTRNASDITTTILI